MPVDELAPVTDESAVDSDSLDSGGDAGGTPDTSGSDALSQSSLSGPAMREEAPTKGLRDLLAERTGMQLPDSDDEVAGMIGELHEAARHAQYIPQLQQRLQFYERKLQELQQAQQAPPAQPEAPVQKPKSSKPEWDPQWLSWVKQDENGKLIPAAPWVPADIVQKVENYARWKSERTEKLLEFDPDDYRSQLEKQYEERLEARLKEMQDSLYTEQSIKSVIASNSPWMHKRGQDGQLVINPYTGLPDLTEDGQLYVEALKYAKSIGVSGAVNQDNAAKWFMAAARSQQGQGGQQPQPAPQQNDPRAAYRNRVFSQGRGQGNRSGSLTAAENNNEPQNPQQKFLQMALQEAKLRGLKD